MNKSFILGAIGKAPISNRKNDMTAFINNLSEDDLSELDKRILSAGLSPISFNKKTTIIVKPKEDENKEDIDNKKTEEDNKKKTIKKKRKLEEEMDQLHIKMNDLSFNFNNVETLVNEKFTEQTTPGNNSETASYGGRYTEYSELVNSKPF